jgi:hypothetical protein
VATLPGDRRPSGKLGQRALLLSLVGHVILAAFLLIQFVVDRARDARDDAFLTVEFSRDTPDKRMQRRPPRLRKQVEGTATPPATHSMQTRQVAAVGVPVDGGYAPSAPVSLGWEGPSVVGTGAPSTPATRFETPSRPAQAPVAASPVPTVPAEVADSLPTAQDTTPAPASLPTARRARAAVTHAEDAPRFDPSMRAAPGPGQKSMTAADIARVPGTTGDVLKALSVMPGISSPMDMSGELFVRGGSAQENRFYFDRIPLEYPYHFGGLTSTISSDIIDRVDVHAGGFGAQFGEGQAVIDISGRTRNRGGFRGSADVNPLLSEWFTQTPVGENGSAYVSGRRSYADLIVPKLIDIEQITAFPRFWDYQAGAEADLSDTQHLKVTTFASEDFMELFFDAEDVEDEPEFAGEFHYRYGFYGRGGTLTSALGERGRLLSTLSQHGADIDFGFGDGFFLNIDQDFYSLRQDAALPLTDSHTLEVGHESTTGDTRTSGFFSLPPQEGDPEFDLVEEAIRAAESSQRFTWLQGYVQDRARLADRLELTLGGRVGYFNLTGDTRFDPRVSLTYEWETGPTLRAAWGVYRQSPQPPEILKNWGNPDVTSTRATHYIIELERQFSDELLVKLAGYYKELDDLVTRDPVAVYLNQGEGFARGLELFAKYTPSDRFLGWLSYTYGRSDRRDTPSDILRPFSFDQRHVATTAFNYRPGVKWDFGVKWQYSTGLPYTPVLYANAVTGAGGKVEYEPVFGPLNSARLAAFHRLDVRLARRFSIAGAPAETYIEALNAYNRKNVFQLEYSDDYTEQDPVYQLPLIPFIGISTSF